MTKSDLINEIQKLSISERIYVIEKTIKSIRTEKDKNTMKKAAELLSSDYKIDSELTAFTDIDFENFYETK